MKLFQNIKTRFSKKKEDAVENIIIRIASYVNNLTYNMKAVFDSEGLDNSCGISRLNSESGNTGLCCVIHTPDYNAYFRMLEFVKQGGKLVYLPMLAGIPNADEASMYSLIGYATPEPAEYLKNYNLTKVFDGLIIPIVRFFPMTDIQKKYDFFIVTWAGDIKHKRWDLVIELIDKLCQEYKMCVIAYKGVPSDNDMKVINKYVDSGSLDFYNKWISKDDFPVFLNSSKVMIVPGEWDNKPRIMDQALLCNVPLAVNSNIYGGKQLINRRTGKLAAPGELSSAAVHVLQNLAGKTETRSWYLENSGPYNAVIDLTQRVNETFNTDYKIIYPEGKKFMFEKDYLEKCNIPSDQAEYYFSLNL